MSNENSTTNKPSQFRVRRGSNVPSGRSRKFSCITYLSETQLKTCLMAHSEQINVYAYAFHDKDEKEDGSLKEPHFHLILNTYNTCTISAVRRWFSGYIDSSGKEITTTAQICSDIYVMYDYLTHNTAEARQEGKYQYDSSIVKTNAKPSYFQGSKESEYDSITIATEMLLKGAKVRDVARIFGRDFILHYGAIRQCVNDILRHSKYNMNLEDILEREYDMEVLKLNE